MNYIFVPNAKYFALPCITLSRWYSAQSQDSTLIIKKGMSNTFETLGVDFVLLDDLYDINFFAEDNYIFFHHGVDSYYSFFINTVSQIVKKNKLQSVNISFIPDGLGNAMWGENFINRYNNEKNDSVVNLLHVFSFGFIHDSALKKFDNVIVIDYSYMVDFFNSNNYLIELCGKIIKGMVLAEENVIFPYRPWCTSSFHGGVYDIGGNQYLADIYTSLLDLFDFDSANIKMYFRGDNRFVDECKDVFNGINKHVFCAEIDETYPSWLTLEPLIYFMLKENKKYNFITLDSTTFQAIPFLANNTESVVIGVFGCPEYLLADNPRSVEFSQKKLKNKMKDFKNRYELFNKNIMPLRIDSIDPCCFTVKVI